MNRYQNQPERYRNREQTNNLVYNYTSFEKPNGDNANIRDGFPNCIILAHAYVPRQSFMKTFLPSEALMKGTLFPDLWGVYRIPK